MSIQSSEARELVKKNAGEPCDHDHPLEKEYYLGSSTGDYICTNCGTSGNGRNWNKK